VLNADNAGLSKQLWSGHNDVVQAARELRELENAKLGHLKDTIIYSFYIRDCESLFKQIKTLIPIKNLELVELGCTIHVNTYTKNTHS
jgi:hypothetical protein